MCSRCCWALVMSVFVLTQVDLGRVVGISRR